MEAALAKTEGNSKAVSTSEIRHEILKPLKPLQKFSLFFFNRPRRTAILCLAIVVFGVASYTTLLRKEGFPPINTPFAISQGTYLVNDPAKVDSEATKPLSEFVLKQAGVKSVTTQSFDNFFVAQIAYEDGVDSVQKSEEIQKNLENSSVMPEQAQVKIDPFKFGFTERGDDLVVSFYSDQAVDYEILIAKANEAAELIKSQNLSLVQDVSIINPFESARNPATGQTEVAQKSFERYGKNINGENRFYDSVVIGVTAAKGADSIKLDDQIKGAVNKLNSNPDFKGYSAEISASNAPQINMQISELLKVLIEGLIAVLIVGSLVIAIRASIITVLAMFTVITAVLGLLYILGYTLNTITLFSIILGLSLIVDDTIIMIEAIDAQRRKHKNPKRAVSEATRKVSRAMIAATSTAALSFAPLIFVGGILGSFIRQIPITIIAALVISLFVALIFIPLFARILMLTPKHMGKKSKNEFSSSIEAAVARTISRPMLWAKHSKAKLAMVCTIAIFIGLGFIGTGGWLFQKVTFNIFPSAKDANYAAVSITYPSGTEISAAESIATDVENIVAEVTGDNLVRAAYYGQTNVQTAILNLEFIDYKDREIKAPELVDKLNQRFDSFGSAQVQARQVDAGPPASAFTARVDSSQNREAATKLADDIATFLEKTELKRIDGSRADIDTVTRPNESIYLRSDNKPYLSVAATYKDTDTTALVTLTQTAVEEEFTPEKVAAYGLDKNALSFDFGQESENQDSFKTLLIAFPVLLGVIYLLLAIQFRSALQPLLIFMAIPFSLLGITAGLYLTDNAFSFFAMLGFFALIGLSIKNTILLTDYANQSMKEGNHPVDAVHDALAERFRPLIATSLTAIFSLIPLALTSPFWEGLAVVLIFGLLSSTFLVITVFPYYYLAAEFIRKRTGRGFKRLIRRA